MARIGSGGRIALGIVAAFVANVAVVSAGEFVTHSLFAVPPGDPATLVDRMSQGARLGVVASWGLGAFAAAMAAALVARRGWLAWVGASITLMGVVATAFSFPHPPWMVAAGIILPVLAAFAASRMVPTRATPLR